MDKDKTIQELNKLNIELARQLDEKNNFIQENSNFLAHDLRIKCIRDLALVKGYCLTEQLSDKEAKLQLSKSFGNPKAIEENKEHEFARFIEAFFRDRICELELLQNAAKKVEKGNTPVG